MRAERNFRTQENEIPYVRSKISVRREKQAGTGRTRRRSQPVIAQVMLLHLLGEHLDVEHVRGLGDILDGAVLVQDVDALTSSLKKPQYYNWLINNIL